MHKSLASVICVVTVLYVHSVRADVVVERICDADAAGTAGTTATTIIVLPSATPGLAITVDIDAINAAFGSCPFGRATFRVRGRAPGGGVDDTEDIGRITFTGSAGNFVNDLIIAPTDAFSVTIVDDFNDQGARDWGGIDPGPYQMQVQAWIKGNLTGSVIAANVLRVRSDGAISADVSQTGIANMRGVLAADSISGDMTSAGG